MLVTGVVEAVCSSLCLAPTKMIAKTQSNSFPNHSLTISHPQLCFLSGIVSVRSDFRNGGASQFFSQQPLLHLSGAGWNIAAVKKQRQGGGSVRIAEIEDVEEDEDDEGEDVDMDIDFDSDAEDSYDESEMLPSEDMKLWLKSKPRGFGEGKVYNTSVEDKLLEEMKQSRRAQLANLNKLKNSHSKQGPAEDTQSKQAPPDLASGVQVRLGNLPKKKNIHRDLKAAFQGVSGIIGLKPAVSGNKKTRDPICKGFAFVHFKHEDDAIRFVQLFSTQTIAFGKVQKRIKCEMLHSPLRSSSFVQLSGDGDTASRLKVLTSERNTVDHLYVNTLATKLWSEVNSGDSDGLGGQISQAESEEIYENPESSTDTELSDVEAEGSNIIEKEKIPNANVENVPRRKLRAKGKKKKVPKLDIPAASRRLKTKDKTVLSDVFSKYGLKAAAKAE